MANIDPRDSAAFTLALATARRDPVQRRRFDDRLASGEAYEEVGRAAAFYCQIESLGLMPWMSPPCFPEMSALDEPYGDVGAKREIAELAQRMERLGISRWHPNPASECDRVEAERAKTAT